MWANHHTVFNHFARLDRNVVYLNLVLLATVVFVPYPTGIFGEALQRGEGERVAAVFYSIVMTVERGRVGRGVALRVVAPATPRARLPRGATPHRNGDVHDRDRSSTSAPSWSGS